MEISATPTSSMVAKAASLRTKPVLDFALDVLNDHDRIVDHDTDREHQTE